MKKLYLYIFLQLLVVEMFAHLALGQSVIVTDSAFDDFRTPNYDQPVNPDVYLVRPGEALTVTFLNTSLVPLQLLVNPEGRLVHTTLGSFDLRGMTLTQVRQVLREPLKKLYSAREIEITIGAPTLVTISVTGAVRKPGTYRGWTSQRVSELIARAGGLLQEGSMRRITFSGGPRTLDVDLDRAIYLGVDTLNPRLYAGNRVEVPYRSHERVQVVGEIQRTRDIELRPGDNVETLLRMAGGVRPSVKEPVIELLGNPSKQLSMADLVSGGVIGVRDANENGRSMVFISGEVNAPGQYSMKSSTSLNDMLTLAGGALPTANLARTTVFRLAELERWNKSEQFRYVIDGMLRGSDVLSFPLIAGDSIVVPRIMGFVKVGGLVAHAAVVPFSADKPVSYYINMVGGVLQDANRSEVNLSNRITRLATRVSMSATVQDGDEIIAVPHEAAP